MGDILADIESTANERDFPLLLCVGNQNQVTENSKLKNIDKHATRVQVQNIDSNQNWSTNSQIITKDISISIKNYEEFFAAFRNITRHSFQERNKTSSLSENNPAY